MVKPNPTKTRTLPLQLALLITGLQKSLEAEDTPLFFDSWGLESSGVDMAHRSHLRVTTQLVIKLRARFLTAPDALGTQVGAPRHVVSISANSNQRHTATKPRL